MRLWHQKLIRGKKIGSDNDLTNTDFFNEVLEEYVKVTKGEIIYLEHNDKYLKECIENLKKQNFVKFLEIILIVMQIPLLGIFIEVKTKL